MCVCARYTNNTFHSSQQLQHLSTTLCTSLNTKCRTTYFTSMTVGWMCVSFIFLNFSKNRFYLMQNSEGIHPRCKIADMNCHPQTVFHQIMVTTEKPKSSSNLNRYQIPYTHSFTPSLMQNKWLRCMFTTEHLNNWNQQLGSGPPDKRFYILANRDLIYQLSLSVIEIEIYTQTCTIYIYTQTGLWYFFGIIPACLFQRHNFSKVIIIIYNEAISYKKLRLLRFKVACLSGHEITLLVAHEGRIIKRPLRMRSGSWFHRYIMSK